MFDRLLFPTDGSDGAAVALDHVLDVAAAHDATVHVLNVADTNLDSVTRLGGEIVDVLEREGEEIVREAAERADRRGVTTVTEVLQGEPYSTIVDYAGARDIDLVVMPTRGSRGLERLLLGSTTERVVRRSEVPVLTLRPDGGEITYPYRNVLVPTDGSDCATAAVDHALSIASVCDATLHALNVIDESVIVGSPGGVLPANYLDSLEQMGEEATDALAERAREQGVDVETAVERGRPGDGIRAYAGDHDVDLVVMGTHGRSGMERFLLGSTTEQVIRTGTCPVLAVPGGDEETAEE